MAYDTKMSKQENLNFLRGMLAMLTEIFLGVIIVTIVKKVGNETPLTIVLFFRYVASLPILILSGFIQRGRNLFKINDLKTLLLRTVCGFLGLFSWYLAITHIELAKAMALNQLVTLIIAVLAPLLLPEIIKKKQFLALFAGLFGVIILIEPGSSGWLNIGLFYGIAAPFFSALMFIFLRKLGQTDFPISISIWYNMCGAATVSALVLLDTSRWTSDLPFSLLISCGILASGQQFLMALAHKLVEATKLAPLHYLAVPIAMLIGVVLFEEPVTLGLIIGTATIIATSYYLTTQKEL